MTIREFPHGRPRSAREAHSTRELQRAPAVGAQPQTRPSTSQSVGGVLGSCAFAGNGPDAVRPGCGSLEAGQKRPEEALESAALGRRK
jgi:hypothetical protein